MDARGMLERRMELLSAGEVEQLLDFYADDAQVVRYVGVARGRDEIRGYFEEYLAAHGRYVVVSIDQFFATDDSAIWQASVDTANGVAQVEDVVVFGEDGLIRREFPGIHGYWGRT